MINGLELFYANSNSGKGLKLIENKGSGCYMTKNNYKKTLKPVKD